MKLKTLQKLRKIGECSPAVQRQSKRVSFAINELLDLLSDAEIGSPEEAVLDIWNELDDGFELFISYLAGY